MSQAVRANGLTATAVCYDTRIELLREGPLSHLGDRLPQREVLPLGALRAVVFEPAGAIETGYVEFVRRGERPTREVSGLTEMAALARASNAVVFTASQSEAFAELRDVVRRRLLARHPDAPGTERRERVFDGDLSEAQYRAELGAPREEAAPEW